MRKRLKKKLLKKATHPWWNIRSREVRPITVQMLRDAWERLADFNRIQEEMTRKTNGSSHS